MTDVQNDKIIFDEGVSGSFLRTVVILAWALAGGVGLTALLGFSEAETLVGSLHAVTTPVLAPNDGRLDTIVIQAGDVLEQGRITDQSSSGLRVGCHYEVI